MQVQNRPQIPNSGATNFKQIKSLKCTGLYAKKEYSQYAENLVKSFKSNPKAIDFCKQYNVDIIFHAWKRAVNTVNSAIHISVDDPSKKKILGLFGNTKKIIEIQAWGSPSYDIKSALDEGTNELIDRISGKTGILDSHMRLTSEEIQEKLAEKADKQFEKELKRQAKLNEKRDYSASAERLNDSINDLIGKTKK